MPDPIAELQRHLNVLAGTGENVNPRSRIKEEGEPYHFTIVDDDEHSVFFVIHALSERFPKSTVTAFHDGTEALEYLLKNHCDCLITDHSMVRMNGEELVKRLRLAGVEIPALMISNSPQARSAAEAAQVTLLDKQSIFRELPDAIADLLGVRCAS